MSNLQEIQIDQVASVIKDSQSFSRFYQTINRLESLSEALGIRITRIRQLFEDAKSRAEQSTCTILAAKLLELQLQRYGLAKEKIEVIKQFQEMIAINKGKLEKSLECFIKNLPAQTSTQKKGDKRKHKQKLRKKTIQMTNKGDKFDLGEESSQTCLDSAETPSESNNDL